MDLTAENKQHIEESEEEINIITDLQNQIREAMDDPDADESMLTLLKDKLKSLQYEQGI